MIREAIEDYIRFKADKGKLTSILFIIPNLFHEYWEYLTSFIETNSQVVHTLRDGVFKELRSDEIVVGDIVFMKEGDTFPADLILLASSNDGVCFIQTSSLDGEKNLKKRSRPKDIDRYILNTFEPDRIIFLGECVSEQPNTELY